MLVNFWQHYIFLKKGFKSFNAREVLKFNFRWRQFEKKI